MPSVRLAGLVQQLDAELHGGGDVVIIGVASMQNAKTDRVTFMVSPKHRKHLAIYQTSAVVMVQNDLPFTRSATLVVRNSYLTYTCMAQTFDTMLQPVQDVAPSTVTDPSVELGSNVVIDTSAAIESGVVLGNSVVTGAGCFVGKNTKVGADPRLWANVTIYCEIEIGKNCLTQFSAVIGVDDFGYANDRGNWTKIPQLGRVIIGDRVEIGACTTIDHGALDNTPIDNGVITDNQCQIAHSVVIGGNTAVTSGVIIASSPEIGRYCMINSASMINGYMEVCNKVIVMGMRMVTRPIPEPGVYSSGIPLQSNKVWHKTAALAINTDEIGKCLKAIERKVSQQD